MADQAAGFLRSLLVRHGGALRRALPALLPGDRDEGEELAQDARLRMHRIRHPQRSESAPPFLTRTAACLTASHLRRIDGAGSSRASEAEPLEDLERQQIALVEQAIAELPSRCRQAFVMHRTRALSYAEIARQLGVSTSMVEKYVVQALKHCRRRLEAGARAPSITPERFGQR